eukprot:COSAG05_NODE_904_length_6658_cov_17.747065_5_plen_101_part_00
MASEPLIKFPELPVTSQGTPRRAAPWIAAALPHIAAHPTAGLLKSFCADGQDGAPRVHFRIDLAHAAEDSLGNIKTAAICVVLRLFLTRIGALCHALYHY